MADANGQLSAAVMERLTVAAAAEPYESVSCAFVSYGSCVMDLAEGWKYRSRLWYGVGLSSKTTAFGGGGSGWESWKSALDKDANGNWVELPLIKKSVFMLQALLLDESGLGGGLGIGGGSGTGMGGMAALFQLLDSDQPFLCMLRMALVSMREEDDGKENMLVDVEDGSPEFSRRQTSNLLSFDVNARMPLRKPRSSLLWRYLLQWSYFAYALFLSVMGDFSVGIFFAKTAFFSFSLPSIAANHFSHCFRKFSIDLCETVNNTLNIPKHKQYKTIF